MTQDGIEIRVWWLKFGEFGDEVGFNKRKIWLGPLHPNKSHAHSQKIYEEKFEEV